MSDQTCGCCGSAAGEQPEDRESSDRRTTADRWLAARPVTDAALPADVGDAFGRFLGEDVATLGDIAAAIREASGGGALVVDDLCHAGAPTPHRATVGDETYYFECFYDGVVLAALRDEPVEIRTESPAGAEIELTMAPNGTVDATPTDAVLSFGIASDVEPPAHDDPPVDEAAIQAICPYVKAFATRRSYESWAAGVDAATVGAPLADGASFAIALTATE